MAEWLLAIGLSFGCSAVYGLDFGQLLNSISKPQEQNQAQSQSQPQGSGALSLLGSALGMAAGTSQDEEIAIGKQISGNLLGAAPLVNDGALQKYVNNVGRWVASQSERPDLPWHFGVIESDDVNAFAAPGGYVFITRGLYLLLQNEAELAGVLGHEIGHVILKHHLKILQQSKLVDVGSKLVANQVGGDNVIQKAIGNGAEIVSRSLDKNAEFEADRVGVVLSARAGYDVFGLPAVLQQIGHFSKDDSSVALLFKTHPHPDERLDKLGVAMGDKFDMVKGLSLKNRFYRISASAPAHPIKSSSTSAGSDSGRQVSSYAGTYGGTFNGSDSGQFQATILPNGTAMLNGHSNKFGVSFTGEGKVNVNGSITLGSASTGATFTGTIANDGALTGTWKNTQYNQAGSFQGAKGVKVEDASPSNPLQAIGGFLGGLGNALAPQH